MSEHQDLGSCESEQRSNIGLALTLLFVGLAVGAVSALLFAPKSGRQMRRSLRRRYQDARDVVEDWGDQAGDYVNKGAEWASEAKKRVAPMASKLRR